MRSITSAGPSVPIDSPAGGEAEEIMPSFSIPSGPQGDRTRGPPCHGVVMLLVRLDVGAELELAMLGVVK
eukprot:scaffold183156_cov29-Attheya_sp.AAC.4